MGYAQDDQKILKALGKAKGDIGGAAEELEK